MTRSVYIVGGAGTGKSTFTDKVLGGLGTWHGPLEDFLSLRNAKALVTLRGHRLQQPGSGRQGLYIGCIRQEFPGTDGLDRATSPVGEAWLDQRGAQEFEFLVSEGATLATSRFLTALHRHTDLLLVHLHVDPAIAEKRFAERGSSQNPTFVRNTVTRSANILAAMNKLGTSSISIDTGDPDAWVLGLDLVLDHLE